MSLARRPHLALILPYLKARGTEKQAVNLALGLQPRGWRVSVVVVQGWGEDSLYNALQLEGINVVNLLPPWRRAVKGASLWRLPALLHCLQGLQCDVVLSRALLSHRVAGLAALLLRRPFVAVYSAGIPPPTTAMRSATAVAWLRAACWRLQLGWPRLLITVSQQSLRHLQQRLVLPIGWAIAIANGVDLGRFAPVLHRPGRVLQIVSVTTLEFDRKGLDVLLQAFEQLLQRAAGAVHLQIVGSGPDADAIAAWIQAHQLQGQIELLGDQPDPRPWLQQADLFVLPSRREGMPNALLEAMACGLCVVAADCHTGPAELIRNGVNGLLVPVGDPTALASAMRSALLDPVLRQRLGQTAAESTRCGHSLDGMLDAYDHELRQLLVEA